jgi:hypothetical protein
MIKKIVLIVLFLFLLGGSAEAVKFKDVMQNVSIGGDSLFPSWKNEIDGDKKGIYPQVDGIVGVNMDGKGEAGEKLLMNYIPHLINILLKFVAPLIMVAMIYAGIRFVYAGSNEEELSQAKDIFTYTLMGALFVVLSYSIMKALYFLLST